ncbi:MAG: glucosaminidase domain-containing protein [Mycoplasmatales bacterium]
MHKIKLSIILVLLVTLLGSTFAASEVYNDEEIFSVKKIKSEEKGFDSFNNSQISIEVVQNEINTNNKSVKTLFNSISPKREQLLSGLQELKINDNEEINGVNEYNLSDESIIRGTSDTNNNFKTYNGKIVYADNAIVYSLGGVDSNIDLYYNLEDAKDEENSVQISGAGFDGLFIDTVESNGKAYAKVLFSGLTAYVDINDVQILPVEFIKSQSFYKVENGDFVFYEALNPLTSNQYVKYPLGSAPEWAEKNVKYYSYDDVNYYTNNVLKGSYRDYNSYFDNLPARSSSMYTSEQYRDYLKHLGKTGSEYYNHTNAFIDAQDKFKVNSLLLFSMAALESSYGQSTYAHECYNFFGRGAFDSNPDNACKGVNFTNAYSGIYSQAIFLRNGYMDDADYRYYGSEVGNKSHGMNVKYASDTNWGKKISSIAYEVDKYLGGHEEKYFRIYEIQRSLNVYKDSSLKTKQQICKSSGTENCTNIDYLIKRNVDADGKYANPRVIVVQDINGKAFRFQLDTPRNNTSSSVCNYTLANYGTSPNYEGTHNLKVSPGTSGFGCDYGKWSSQTAWYNMKASDGGWSYKKINDVSAKSPQEYNIKTSSTFYPSGNVECYQEETLNSSGRTTKNEKWCYQDLVEKKTKSHTLSNYDSAGHNIYYQSDQYYSNGNQSYKNIIKRNSSNVITEKDLSHYFSNGNVKDQVIQEYYSNGKEKDYVKKIYYENGVRAHYGHVMRNTNGSREYERTLKNYSNTKLKDDLMLTYIGTTGQVEKREEKEYFDTGIEKSNIVQKYNSSTYKENDYIKETFYSNGVRAHYGHVMRNINGSREYERTLEKYSNGNNKLDLMLTYIGTTGNVEKKEESQFYDNGKTKQKLIQKFDSKTYKEIDWIRNKYQYDGKNSAYGHVMRQSNGKRKYERAFEYKNGIMTRDNMIKYYTNGGRRDYLEHQYNPSNNVETLYEHIMYFSNGSKDYSRKIVRDNSGKVIEDKTNNY